MDAALQCTLCSNRYNTADRIPRFLPCGHTFCNSCLISILAHPSPECPDDSVAIPYSSPDLLPKNVLLLKLVSKTKQILCTEHKKKLEYVCMTEKIKICSYCALLGAHKDHDVKPLEEIMNEVHMRARCLLDMLEMMDRTEIEIDGTVMDYLEKVNKKFVQKKSETEEKIKKKFKKIRKLIDTLEKSTLETVAKNIEFIESAITAAKETPKRICAQSREWKDVARDVLDLVDARCEDPNSVVFEILGKDTNDLLSFGEKLLTELDGARAITNQKFDDMIESLKVEFAEKGVNNLCKVYPLSTFNFKQEEPQTESLIGHSPDSSLV
ncbi:unnamed protein product [Blepharisma stoltei]|uniref:RING-type domain-containing protein n=1 Tax=Blepharisma stoltei TaxID=1481888 RepID=A0AAU9K7L9_9CILI|nr:unnamed protein product [Blepharisma stoltei]